MHKTITYYPRLQNGWLSHGVYEGKNVLILLDVNRQIDESDISKHSLAEVLNELCVYCRECELKCESWHVKSELRWNTS
jgi:MinD superfamily P-loop ATPase